MRYSLKIKLFLVALVVGGFFCPGTVVSSDEISPELDARIRASVVKIYNISQRPNYDNPWKDLDFSRGAGSGVIISGQRILTSAHVVSDSKYLQVSKENDATPYKAKVSFIGHDCDLALLEVEDKSFFSGTSSLTFSEKFPPLGSKVMLYGFPVGGRKISLTKGIISRIDYMIYSHFGLETRLAIQIDAAINFGNSGGPAIHQGTILGIAFQAIKSAENIGYLIPFTVIDHFLEDIKDGSYDGYPELGLFYMNLINPAYRDFLGLAPEQSGVVVTQVIDGLSAAGVIFPGDVLLSIGGSPIRNDGTILIDGDSSRLEEVVERLQLNEKLSVCLLRNGKKQEVEVILKPETSRMSRGNEYETRPEYFVYGGLIFAPLSREYLKTWKGKWWHRAKKQLLYKHFYYYRDELYRNYPEPIILVRVLPGEANTYYTGLANRIVSRINGRRISSIEDVIQAYEHPLGKYNVIEFEGKHAICVMDADKMKQENQELLDTYKISCDRYLKPSRQESEEVTP